MLRKDALNRLLHCLLDFTAFASAALAAHVLNQENHISTPILKEVQHQFNAQVASLPSLEDALDLLQTGLFYLRV